ncbi:hypothetical protein DH2020_037179 [Rehmannia glutinosa]|uniref:Uncharacterized protein n=1 Tax=Rehmannia glutinosa TaxID=99300 RepID=A0ABR0V2D0_REHGL
MGGAGYGLERRSRLFCSNKIKLVGNEKITIDTHLVKGKKNELRRKFSLRLRPSEGVVDNNADKDVARNNEEGKNAFVKLKKSRNSSPDWEFSTRKIDHDEGYLLSLMRETGTSYGSAPQSVLVTLRSMLITVLTLWIPLTPLMWILYRQLSAANSPAKKRRPTNQLVGFEDVEGVDGAKVELMEIVCCLQGAINYSKLGAKLPRVSASEFVELFVGRGAARIRDLFSVARKNAPSIVFIDELDAVGGKRGRSFNDERDQTLNQTRSLGPSSVSTGRFSRKVYVGEPDEDGRKKILAIHLRGVPLEEDMGLICNLVASLTQGFVGADLANIVNEAALLAARRGAESVSREDIMEAIERAKFE